MAFHGRFLVRSLTRLNFGSVPRAAFAPAPARWYSATTPTATAVNDAIADDQDAIPDANPIDKDTASFASVGMSEFTMGVLKKRDIHSLFPIQSATYQAVMDGKDMMAKARTL
jgi:hypothetical protein